MVGDIVGVTTYRKVWQEQFKYYLSYHFPAIFYERRANLLKVFLGKRLLEQSFKQSHGVNIQ